jgi:hypothetical protein
MTTLVDCQADDLVIGMALDVTYRAISDEITIPVFRPA